MEVGVKGRWGATKYESMSPTCCNACVASRWQFKRRQPPAGKTYTSEGQPASVARRYLGR